MGRKRECIHAKLGEIDRNVAHRLHRIGMEGHAMRMCACGERRDMLNRSYLIVGKHDRYKCDHGARCSIVFARLNGAERGFKVFNRNEALIVYREKGCLHAFPLQCAAGV